VPWCKNHGIDNANADRLIRIAQRFGGILVSETKIDIDFGALAALATSTAPIAAAEEAVKLAIDGDTMIFTPRRPFPTTPLPAPRAPDSRNAPRPYSDTRRSFRVCAASWRARRGYDPGGGLHSIPEAPAMTLDQWLSTPRLLPAADFARLCGASPAAVSRWRRGMIPAPDHMRAIYRVTRGQVDADAFYGLPERGAAGSGSPSRCKISSIGSSGRLTRCGMRNSAGQAPSPSAGAGFGPWRSGR
jgi:hypothetical protein